MPDNEEQVEVDVQRETFESSFRKVDCFSVASCRKRSLKHTAWLFFHPERVWFTGLLFSEVMIAHISSRGLLNPAP